MKNDIFFSFRYIKNNKISLMNSWLYNIYKNDFYPIEQNFNNFKKIFSSGIYFFHRGIEKNEENIEYLTIYENFFLKNKKISKSTFFYSKYSFFRFIFMIIDFLSVEEMKSFFEEIIFYKISCENQYPTKITRLNLYEEILKNYDENFIENFINFRKNCVFLYKKNYEKFQGKITNLSFIFFDKMYFALKRNKNFKDYDHCLIYFRDKKNDASLKKYSNLNIKNLYCRKDFIFFVSKEQEATDMKYYLKISIDANENMFFLLDKKNIFFVYDFLYKLYHGVDFYNISLINKKDEIK